MTSVEIQSFVRARDGEFVPIVEVPRFGGECRYVAGAISLKVDGLELFGLDLWDDVNWLWPFVVQALKDCRRTGAGKRGFPDQPISIIAERARPGHTLIRVTDGASINRTAVAADADLFGAVARAGMIFFAELFRLCPAEDMGSEENDVLMTWLTGSP